MKPLSTLLIVLLLAGSASLAKTKYDHIGKMVYHSPVVKNLLEGRTDLYYDDNFYGDSYICTPGDEHHAPDCRKQIDWLLVVKESYVDVILDDGKTLIVNEREIGTDLADTALAWQQHGRAFTDGNRSHDMLTDGDSTTFVYDCTKAE